MALIKCPECGSEISSNAKQCVRCGCEITCCPECLKVFKGKVEVCDGCGFAFQSRKEDNKISNEAQTQKIQQTIEADNKTHKKVAIVAKIIEIVSSLLLILPMILYFHWDKLDDIGAKAEQMTSLFNGLKVLTVVTVTTFVLSFFIDDAVEYFLETRRINWLQNQKFDYKTFIKEYHAFDVEGKDTQWELTLIKKAVFKLENPSEKNYSLVILMLQIVLILLVDICTCVWVISNLNGLYMAKFFSFDAEYSWKFGEASFIAAIVFLALEIVVAIFASTPQDNRFKKWCSKFDLDN